MEKRITKIDVHIFRLFNQKIEAFLCTKEDSDSTRARKVTTFWGLALSVIFPISWLFLYEQYGLSLAVRFQYAVITLGILEFIFFLWIKNYTISIHLIMLRLHAILIAHHIFLGGFLHSGMALTSLILGPMIASVLLGRRATYVYSALYFLVIFAAGAFETQLAETAPDIPPSFSLANLVMSLVANGVFILSINNYLVSQLDEARERADSLLLNILPAPIAARLKRRRSTIAQHYEHAGILFADIVGFTPLSTILEPEELVEQLNLIYTAFDEQAKRFGVEKITTIGDSYMVASGVPTPKSRHLESLAKMALAMLAVGERLPEIKGRKLQMRIGMHAGPLVAGVIGQDKFQYDVWGDTVNTASRMESHGLPGKIQVSQQVYERLKGLYAFEARGEIDVKGKGKMPTWFLSQLLDLS